LVVVGVVVVVLSGGGTGVIGAVPVASDVTTGVVCAVFSSKGQAFTGSDAVTMARTNNEANSLVMGDLRPRKNDAYYRLAACESSASRFTNG